MGEAIRLTVSEHRLVEQLLRPGRCVIRQTAETEAAIRNGGYVYSLHPGGMAVSARLCQAMMRKALLVSAGDDLFADRDRGGADVQAGIAPAGPDAAQVAGA